MLDVLALVDPSQIQHWLIAGGYFALLGVLLACGLGLPVPEDIPLIVSGALIASGHMIWPLAGLAAWTGIIGGDLILYHIARRYGRNITRLPFIGNHITLSRLDRVEKLFERYGIWVVGFGRLFAGIRAAMVVTAGTIQFNRVKFVIADGIAAIVSGGLFMLLGFYLGKNLPALMAKVEHGKTWFLIGGLIVAVALGVWFVLHSRRRTRKQAAASAPRGPASDAPEPDAPASDAPVTR